MVHDRAFIGVSPTPLKSVGPKSHEPLSILLFEKMIQTADTYHTYKEILPNFLTDKTDNLLLRSQLG